MGNSIFTVRLDLFNNLVETLDFFKVIVRLAEIVLTLYKNLSESFYSWRKPFYTNIEVGQIRAFLLRVANIHKIINSKFLVYP